MTTVFFGVSFIFAIAVSFIVSILHEALSDLPKEVLNDPVSSYAIHTSMELVIDRHWGWIARSIPAMAFTTTSPESNVNVI